MSRDYALCRLRAGNPREEVRKRAKFEDGKGFAGAPANSDAIFCSVRTVSAKKPPSGCAVRGEGSVISCGRDEGEERSRCTLELERGDEARIGLNVRVA